MNWEPQIVEVERELDRTLAQLPATPLAPVVLARIRAATLREAERALLRRTSATWGRWLSAVAAGIALLIGSRLQYWSGGVEPPAQPQGNLMVMDAEGELEAWDAAVLVSGWHFATLLTEESVEPTKLRMDEESIERLMDSIDSGLSLTGQDGT